MRTPKQILAGISAWKEYNAEVQRMDSHLADLMDQGHKPGSPAFDEAWHDRNGFAANRYPGAPEQQEMTKEDLASVDHCDWCRDQAATEPEAT